MIDIYHRVQRFLERHAPYALAIQVLVSLVLVTVPLSVLGLDAQLRVVINAAPHRFWALATFFFVYLCAFWLVPVQKFPRWLQVGYLCVQCAIAVAAPAILPTPVLDYVYLAIIFQAINLFRPWLWIPFTVAVGLVWSGSIFIASENFFAWIQSNLAIAFPTTCFIIAAIVYARQQRRNEQVEQLLQQVQQRYDTLTLALRELQQNTALEERQRLTQTMTDDLRTMLAGTEQNIAAALTLAQTNMSRLQTTVIQTRHTASTAIERLRTAIVTLRGDDMEPLGPTPNAATAALPRFVADDSILSKRSIAVLSWVLPLVFVCLAPLLTLLQENTSPLLMLYCLIFCGVLVLMYSLTQHTKNPFLLQAGLAGQALSVVGLATLTQTLPLLLGLLLILWQIAIRLPFNQILILLAGVPTAVSLLIAGVRPEWLRDEHVVIFGMAAIIVAAPLLLARRQVYQRRESQQQLVRLSSEIDEQTAAVRALAVAAERTRLAREFHDDLGSKLVLINLQLQLAEDLIEEDVAQALQQLEVSREHLHDAWQSVIAVADAALPLNGAMLEDALTKLADQCHQSTRARLTLHIEGPLVDLEPAVVCTVYRAVQEGLTNAYKHARARNIAVSVIHAMDWVNVSITDDGPGNAQPTMELPWVNSQSQGSFGILGLRERAELLGGGVDASAMSDGGFRLRLMLPADGVAA